MNETENPEPGYFDMLDFRCLTEGAPIAQNYPSLGEGIANTILKKYAAESKGLNLGRSRQGEWGKYMAEMLPVIHKTGRFDEFVKLDESAAAVTFYHSGAGSSANQSALSTIMVANFIEERIKPKLLEGGVFRISSNFNYKGHTGMKFPIHLQQVAVELPDSSALSLTGLQYSHAQIDVKYWHVYDRVTVQTLETASADVLADRMRQHSYAMARAMDLDHVSKLYAATPYSGGWTNANGKYFGASTYLTWDGLQDCIGEMSTLGRLTHATTKQYTGSNYPNKLILHPFQYAKLVKDDDLRAMISFAQAPGTKDFAGQFSPSNPGYIAGIQMITTDMIWDTAATAGLPGTGHQFDDIYLVNSERAGWHLQGVPLKVIDNPTPTGYAARDIATYSAWGAGVTQHEAVYRMVTHSSDEAE